MILMTMMMTTKKREMGSVGRLKRKPALGVADFCLLAQLRSTQEHYREFTNTLKLKQLRCEPCEFHTLSVVYVLNIDGGGGYTSYLPVPEKNQLDQLTWNVT